MNPVSFGSFYHPEKLAQKRPNAQKFQGESTPAPTNNQAGLIHPLLFASRKPIQGQVQFGRSTRPPQLPSGSGDSESQGVQALLAQVGEKSPLLLEWLKPTPKYPNADKTSGGQVVVPPLPVMLYSAVQLAKTATESQNWFHRKHTPDDPEQALAWESLNALMPLEARQNMSPSEVVERLDKLEKQLSNLAVSVANFRRATGHAQRFLTGFMQDSPDYSPAAFVKYLQNNLPSQDQDELKILGQVLLEADPNPSRLNAALLAKECPTLMQFSENLTQKGLDGELPNVYLRKRDTERLMAILGGEGKRTSALINEPAGEGKTYLLYDLAQHLADGDAPESLQGMQLVQISPNSFLAGTMYRGQLEERMKIAFDELARFLKNHPDQKVGLAIDEIHDMNIGGTTQGSPGLVTVLKEQGILENEQISMVGLTTPEDWRRSPISRDNAIQRRFMPFAMTKFSTDEKRAVLGMAANALKAKTGIVTSPQVLRSILDEAVSRWPNSALGRAEDLLHLAASLAVSPRLELAYLEDSRDAKQMWLDTLRTQQAEGTKLKGKYTRQTALLPLDERQLKKLPGEIKSLNREIRQMRKKAKEASNDLPVVTDYSVRQALAVLTGVDLGLITQSEMEKIWDAKKIIEDEIIGQSEAAETVAKALRQIIIRKRKGDIPNRPITSMLMVGPTGVGKTEVCKLLAREFFDDSLIQLNMSEYMEAHQVSRLLGAPPGYVGYDDGGLLEQVREKPQSVIIFDEIEKAHPSVWNVLLQILEEGTISDNQGKPVSFVNTAIAITSNLNQAELVKLVSKHRAAAVGKDAERSAEELEAKVRRLLTADDLSGSFGLRTEQLNRIDHVIPFNPLGPDDINAILDVRLEELNRSKGIQDYGLTVELSDSARSRLIDLATTSVQQPIQKEKPSAGWAFNRPKTETEKPVEQEEELQLQGGARDVRRTFQRQVEEFVFNQLAMDMQLSQVQDAVLTVDYDPESGCFSLKVDDGTVSGACNKNPKRDPNGKTIAFA